MIQVAEIILAVIWIGCVALLLRMVRSMGDDRGIQLSADAEVSDDPPAWWKQAKIMAKARRDAEVVK